MGTARQPRVLVVESDPQVRHLVQRVLERRGCVVEGVADTKLALGALMSGTFNAVVVDTDALGMSGTSMYEMALSASPELEQRFVFLGSGERCPPGARQVDKPFAMDALWQQVRAILPEATDASGRA